MISLFLVEDERIARESIRDNVPWQAHDIMFLGYAPDGAVALPQILEKRPDILLTDIKMPFMDGLELSRIVRKELPDTRIIILSGHNEFEYARKAITLGVNDYLLKPVSSQDILEAVDRSRVQILEQRARQVERQSYATAQRELLFSNLYSGVLVSPAQLIRRGNQLGISLAAGAYQIVLAKLSGPMSDRAVLREQLYTAPMAYGSGFDGEHAAFLLLSDDTAGLFCNPDGLFRSFPHAFMGHGQRAEMEDLRIPDQLLRNLVSGQHHVRTRIPIEGEVPVPVRECVDQGKSGMYLFVHLKVSRINPHFFDG